MTKELNQQKTPRRILILGSSNHTKLVDAYEWDKLPANLNVSDFDTVILNYAPFQEKGYSKGISIDLIPKWQQFARHIFSQGSEIIVIGSPIFALGSNPYLPSTWWLPVEPNFVNEAGEDIREIDPDFAYYFASVKNWHFYLEGISEKFGISIQDYLAIGASSATAFETKVEPLASTRFHRPIGFTIYFNTYLVKSRTVTDRLPTSGSIYWLPEPTEISASESIDLILRERYGLQFEKTPPKWLEKFQLPSQVEIINRIKEKKDEINNLTKQLEFDQQRLVQASRFLKLLYEQGEDVLEPIVRDALRALGSEVQDPKRKGREDGRFTDPFERKGMLEVKGREGNLKLSDVRELDNWVRDAIANENHHSKGILIVNLQCKDDPHKRSNFIPPNCADAAKTFDISILTTSQLFQALVSDQKGNLDRKVFWDKVITSKGICDLPSIT